MTNKLVERLGIPGVLGLGLLLFCFSFYLGSVVPAGSELTNIKLAEAQLQARFPKAVEARRPALPVLHEQPTSISALPGLLKTLNSMAEQRGVTIDQASYTLVDRGGRRWMEISLPLKAGYPSLRMYLRDVLMLDTSPVLDALTLKRPQPTDSVVEANVRLSYLLSSVEPAQ
jgi:hypothetical protein